MPRILTDDQRMTRFDISRYLPSRYEDDPGDFILRVVTLTDSQCSALAGQRPCPHVTSYHLKSFLTPPPYSPDMAPSDFYLFPKLKSHHGNNKGVIEAVNEYLGDQGKAFYFEG